MHIFRHIFLSNYWWQKSDIWSQASYRYPISREAFLDPLDSYFLFADFVDFLYTLNIYAHFLLHFSQQLLMAEIWYLSQASYRYPILWEAFLDPSDSYFLFADFVDFYTHWTYILYMPIFSRIFLSDYWGRNLIFGHKLHIGTPYRGKRYLTRQIPTFCLPKSGVS